MLLSSVTNGFKAKISALMLQCIFIWIFIVGGFLVQGVYYCSTTRGRVVTISGAVLGEIKTLLDNGESSYGNHRDCVWVIDAGTNKRVWIEVLSSHLQWAPSTNAICDGYDYMEVRNGFTSSSSEIVSWCGSQNPHHILSPGQYLYLRFRTNSQNIYSYAGIHLRFGTYDEQACPPISFPYSHGKSSLCLMVFEESVPWKTAQEHCWRVQSNLVKIYSSNMAAFVTSKVLQNTSQTSYWIGLHDITEENHFLWIDGTKPTYHKLGSNTGSDWDDCVAVDTSTNHWVERNCEKNEPAYVCSMVAGGPFRIYHVPVVKVEDREDPLLSPLVLGLIIAGVVVFIALLITIPLVVFCKIKKKREQKRRTPTVNLPGVQQEDQTRGMNSHQNPATRSEQYPSAPPPYAADPRPSEVSVHPPPPYNPVYDVHQQNDNPHENRHFPLLY